MIDGIAMGSSAGPTLADIFLNYIETEAISTALSNQAIRLFKRFLDYILCVWNTPSGMEASSAKTNAIKLLNDIYSAPDKSDIHGNRLSLEDFQIATGEELTKGSTIIFLDLEIYGIQDPDDPDKVLLQHKPYFKPISNYQYIPPNSYHVPDSPLIYIH